MKKLFFLALLLSLGASFVQAQIVRPGGGSGSGSGIPTVASLPATPSGTNYLVYCSGCTPVGDYYWNGVTWTRICGWKYVADLTTTSIPQPYSLTDCTIYVTTTTGTNQYWVIATTTTLWELNLGGSGGGGSTTIPLTLISTSGGNQAVTLTMPTSGIAEFRYAKSTTDGNSVTINLSSGAFNVGGTSYIFSDLLTKIITCSTTVCTVAGQ